MSPEAAARVKELNQERKQLLRTLLGTDPEESRSAQPGTNPSMARYAFLPADKIDRVLEVGKELEPERERVIKPGTRLSDINQGLHNQQKQLENRLAQFLTPEELFEYQLRFSMTASILRQSLELFEPSEQEFRSIFALRKEFEDSFGVPGSTGSTESLPERASAEKELNSQIRNLLGDERFAEYERSQDSGYRALAQLGRQEGLARDTVLEAYGIKHAAEEKAEMLQRDRAISPEQREAALQVIRDETEKALIGVLGAKAFESYRKTSSAH